MRDGRHISYDDDISEIWPEGLAHIAEVRRRVYPLSRPEPKPWPSRYAPSIITRSEAQIFGISSPRFARRVYLDEDHVFFINARRMPTFLGNAKYDFGALHGMLPKNVVMKGEGEAATLGACCSGPVIADSLLPVGRYEDEYEIVTAELGRLYGEIWGDTPDVRGMPYIMHMRMGGGMCSQAVAFLATLLLHRWADSVHGVAEITALARSEEEGVLRISGLRMEELARYFEEIGLRGIEQRLWAPPRGIAADAELLTFAARAYLLSGMPVVLPLDMGRMAGDGGGVGLSCEALYESNRVPGSRYPARVQGEMRHSVLLTGCSKRFDSRFLFSDTAMYPFMDGDAAQLLDARCYAKSSHREKLLPFSFMPVTPGEVKLPLQAPATVSGTGVGKTGLLGMAHTLQYSDEAPALPRIRPDRWPGTVRLMRLGEIRDRARAFAPEDLLQAVAETIRLDANLWCWVQYARNPDFCQPADALYVWDATCSPPPKWSVPSAVRPYVLLAVAHLHDSIQVVPGQFSERTHNNHSPSEEAQETVPEQADFQPCVMSSFSVARGFSGALADWPKEADVRDCELYALMEADCERLLANCQGLKQGETRNAVKALSQLDDASAKEVCSAIQEEILRADCGIKVTGLASFIPEIADRKRASYEIGQEALRGLIRLAAALQKSGHPAHTVEIVGGSLIQGVCPARYVTKNETFDLLLARKDAPNQAMRRLCANLRPIARCAAQHHVYLSVELEPGPLNIVRDLPTLEAFCEALGEDAILESQVGLNADWAHWSLAKIDPRQVGDEIIWRIVHCHASSTGPGHFGDLVLGDVPGDGLLVEWIKMARRAAAKRPRGVRSPPFSGRVSIELEACEHSAMVVRSVRRLTTASKLVARHGRLPENWCEEADQ